MIHLNGVLGTDARKAWPSVEPWIAQACADEGGSYLPEDILSAVETRQMQMWLVLDEVEVIAVAITRIEATPRRKICWVVMMLGLELEVWAHFRDTIAAWAKSQGCHGKRAMKSLARRGYVKLFKEFGCTHVLLERDL